VTSDSVTSDSVTSDNDAEPDDIPNQAQTIPLDSTRSGHLGYYSTALGNDSYDWFKVVVPASRTLRFTSLTTDGNLDLQLYLYTSVSDMTISNPNGSYVGGGGTQLRDTASTTVPAGTYYLQVERRSGIGSYSLACGTAVRLARSGGFQIAQMLAHHRLPLGKQGDRGLLVAAQGQHRQAFHGQRQRGETPGAPKQVQYARLHPAHGIIQRTQHGIEPGSTVGIEHLQEIKSHWFRDRREGDPAEMQRLQQIVRPGHQGHLIEQVRIPVGPVDPQ